VCYGEILMRRLSPHTMSSYRDASLIHGLKRFIPDKAKIFTRIGSALTLEFNKVPGLEILSSSIHGKRSQRELEIL
jgi:hypothetical protein